MVPIEIASSWRTTFGAAMPAGFLCRQEFPARWLRIHSLPESARYAKSDADRLEMLKRHNSVATATLGDNTRCLLFLAKYSESTDDFSSDILLPGVTSFSHVLTHFGEESEDTIQFFAAEIDWEHGHFNAFILAAAEGTIGPLLFANLARGTIYAPYDGGADLILSSQDAVDIAKRRWSAWLSTRLDGL